MNVLTSLAHIYAKMQAAGKVGKTYVLSKGATTQKRLGPLQLILGFI